MNQILIRKATNKDSPAVADLIFDIWLNEYHFDVKKEEFPDLQDIDSYYSNSNGLFLVALINNSIVGTIAGNRLEPHQWVLKRMFVKKNYRQLGIAQALLNKLLNEIAVLENNNATVFLSTKETQALAAKAFYLKNDFQVIKKSFLPRNFPFFYEDDLFMMKRLTA